MSGHVRLWRSLAAASGATLTALVFHAGAGGAGSVLAVVVAFVLTLWVGAMLARRRLGVLSLTAVVALAQVLLHGTMTVFSAGPIEVRSMHSGAELLVLGTAGSTTHAAHAAHVAGAGTGSAMLLAHLCATVLTVAFLRHGEGMLLALFDEFLAPLALLLAPRAQLVQRRAPRTPRSPLVLRVSTAVLGAQFRRGPPSALPA
ncbi:hypothetical protein MTQ12_03845 [Brevibacterium sp. R8603A2]|uniref:hypothetical protein n=1 Tax=Brevibacterium sp. R8603A2 TaxID=2929779 RepID=UPI001FF9D974|nr:hypothetical protein [Brevibacterium sp. R8603A2]MCK1802189.1 hypothetical protein [Brevibacterium sp. R8603A2]